jgi:AAA ATPase domain
LTGDHLIGNAGNVRDLGRDREAGIFEPLPSAEDFVNPPILTVIFEEADPEFDDLVAIGVGAGGFDIHDGGDELWTAIGWVVFGLRLQPTADAIIAALDERPGHLFERRFHFADIDNLKAVFKRSEHRLSGFARRGRDFRFHKGQSKMPRIRKVEIANFRGIREFSWLPSAGINCLIGPGDSGKSSVLVAIDLCLGARRTAQLTDADFHNLDVTKPIRISLTIGELDDSLKTMEGYGMFLRGFRAATGEIEDEPERDAETVLTLTLNVAGDLEPIWTLESERAAAQNLTRNLNWSDRARVAPTRISGMGDYNLGWRRGSVLNRLSEERPDASAALAEAARNARAAFGDGAEEQLGETLKMVADAARDLGIPVGGSVKALLDSHSASFSGGTISLHDEGGVPLRSLGLGSARLLVAGLQRKAADRSTIILASFSSCVRSAPSTKHATSASRMISRGLSALSLTHFSRPRLSSAKEQAR